MSQVGAGDEMERARDRSRELQYPPTTCAQEGDRTELVDIGNRRNREIEKQRNREEKQRGADVTVCDAATFPNGAWSALIEM